jgi:hypothetical protein
MKINLLQEEIDQLVKIKERTEKLVANLGEIAVQKARLNLVEQAYLGELQELMIEEESASESLVKKYGPVSVNIEDGTATKIT